MLHGTHTVLFIVGIGIDFRSRSLSTGRMRMGYGQRLAAEAVRSGGDVMTTQHILLHLLRYPSLNVIIEGRVELGVRTEHLGHDAGQETAAVARSIVGIVAVAAYGTTQRCIVVVVVLQIYPR